MPFAYNFLAAKLPLFIYNCHYLRLYAARSTRICKLGTFYNKCNSIFGPTSGQRRPHTISHRYWFPSVRSHDKGNGHVRFIINACPATNWVCPKFQYVHRYDMTLSILIKNSVSIDIKSISVIMMEEGPRYETLVTDWLSVLISSGRHGIKMYINSLIVIPSEWIWKGYWQNIALIFIY